MKSRQNLEEYTQKITGDCGLEIYILPILKNNFYVAKAFVGKGIKPIWFNRFHTKDSMWAKINDTINHYRDIYKEKLAEKAFDATQHYKIGDIIVNSWGYGQTNVDAYITEKVTKKRITLRKIETQKVSGTDGMMCCDVIPRVTKYGDTIVVGVNQYGVNFKYGGSSLWDGKRDYYNSWYA